MAKPKGSQIKSKSVSVKHNSPLPNRNSATFSKRRREENPLHNGPMTRAKRRKLDQMVNENSAIDRISYALKIVLKRLTTEELIVYTNRRDRLKC